MAGEARARPLVMSVWLPCEPVHGRTARERGLRVPEDLSVVGFDDSEQAEIVSPTLTTVRQPVRGSRIAFKPSTSGTPGCERRNRSMPSRNGEITLEPSNSTWRAKRRSQTAWSSAVNASQHCGTT